MPAAVVLAAGASSRFGADKLTSEIKLGELAAPLVVHSLRPWLDVFEQVVLVLRPQGEAVRNALSGHFDPSRFEFVVCEHAVQGMSASIASGVSAAADADGWLIGLADMPCVPVVAIDAVRQAIADDSALAAPFYNAQRGHPVGFSCRYLNELVSLSGDQGAKALLQRDAALIHRIETADAGILLDIDKPSDMLGLA